MLRELLRIIWTLGINDPELIQLFTCPDATTPGVPKFYLSKAPNDTPMPYVTYGIVRGNGQDWPMCSHMLIFRVYDFNSSKDRVLAIAERIGCLYVMRGYLSDNENAVNSVRTYDKQGPDEIDTDSKNVSCYQVMFPLRALDAAGLIAKATEDR